MKTGNLTSSCAAWLAGLVIFMYFSTDSAQAYNYNYGSLLNSQHAKDADTKVPSLHTSIKAETFKNFPEPQRRSSKNDDELCRSVCAFCRGVVSLRWAALCFVQCEQGGRAYDACVTIWTMRRVIQTNRKIHV